MLLISDPLYLIKVIRALHLTRVLQLEMPLECLTLNLLNLNTDIRHNPNHNSTLHVRN